MEDHKPPRRIRGASIAALSTLTGCLSLIIVLTALVVGLWLDSQMGRRGPATIILLVLSIPVSVFVMLRIAIAFSKRLVQPVTGDDQDSISNEEEEGSS